MALASVKDGKYLELTLDGSTDWTWDDASHGWAGAKDISLERINFYPTAADDTVIIRNGGIDGPIMFKSTAADAYDERVEYYYGEKCRPVIDASDGATNGAVVVFVVK